MTQPNFPLERNAPHSSIEEGLFVNVHGLDQWVTIRGRNVSNPVLFIVPGPGAGLSRMAAFFAPWEQDYTLVQWDQPGAGATLAKHGSEASGKLSYDRLVRDSIAIVEFVRARLSVPRVLLLALSGGTILGLKLIMERPDLFLAYIGSGQIIHWARQDALSYEMLLQQARASGNDEEMAELIRIGPPPYLTTLADSIKSKYAGRPTQNEQLALAQLDPIVMMSMSTPPSGANYVPEGLRLEDIRKTSTAAYDALRDEIVNFDADKLGGQFAVPIYFLQGEQDMLTTNVEVERYFNHIRAPRKGLGFIEGGGHSPYLMREMFLAALKNQVTGVGSQNDASKTD